ncbi:MAG TPA: hypothetical protein PKN30_13630 [Flavobacteriales bacterium]|nr:hypothetical protein [Flavobacteriales bacterium]
MRHHHLPTALLVALFPLFLAAQPGSLDPSFSGDGLLVSGLFTGNDFARDVVGLPSGAVLAAGNAVVEGVSRFAVSRTLADGSLDTDFNGVGYATIGFDDFNDACFAMTLDADGAIVLAGYSNNGVQNELALARLTADGAPDPGFGGNGSVRLSLAPVSVEIYALAIQPDGRIVVAGNAFNGITGGILVARFNADGSPDTDFNGTGHVITNVGDNAVGYGLAVLPDGKLVVGGYAEDSTGPDLLVARYESDGSPDADFGTDGVVTTDLGQFWERIRAITIDADGSIIFVGTVGTSFAMMDVLVGRFLANGSLDPAFDVDGVLSIDVAGGVEDGTDILLQPDGRLLVCGSGEVSGQAQVLLARLEQSGALDASFGTDGLVLTDVASGDDYAAALALAPDGKILVAGSNAGSLGSDALLARYFSGLPIGVDEHGEGQRSLQLWPVPAVDHLFVVHESHDPSARLWVVAANGQIVTEQHMSARQQVRLDIADLAPGNYQVVVADKSGRSEGRFTKVGR